MLQKIIDNNPNNTLVQLFKYTFVGGIAFIFDFGSLYVLTEIYNIHYMISAAIAFLIGLSINYYLSIVWVFKKRSLKSKSLEFSIFMLIGLVGLILNELFIWIFTEIANIYYLNSKILSTFLVYLWNFFIRKYILFK